MKAKSGKRKIDNKNNKEVTKDEKPVFPPAAIPAPDSTKVVTVEVPIIAPAQVAIESAAIIRS